MATTTTTKRPARSRTTNTVKSIEPTNTKNESERVTMITEAPIDAEYDIDDDYVSDRGLLPASIDIKQMERESGADARKQHWVCTDPRNKEYFGRVFAMPKGWNPSMGNNPPTKVVKDTLVNGGSMDRLAVNTRKS